MRYNSKDFSFLLFCIALSGCNSDNNDSDNSSLNNTETVQNSTETTQISLTEGSFTLNRSLGEVVFTKDGVSSNPLALDTGFGSGAYHYPADSADIFYTVTDRGPNIACADSGDIFGITDFCPENGDKIFPQPSFAPSIFKIQISKSDAGNYQYEILEHIELKNSSGNNITGLTNNLVSTDTEIGVDSDAAILNFNNEGLDTEALVRLADGSFWLTDEYGPSLIHVAADGTIIERVVPVSVAADLADADYTVTGLLPDIHKKRKLNRGIESIAISPDEKYLYFIMQSPLQNPDYTKSRNVRLMKLELNADGSINSLVGEYVYRLDTPQSFAKPDGTGDVDKAQKDVKVSEMLALATDDLLVLERISKTTKLYRINIATADNILNSTFDDEANSPTLEETVDTAAVNAMPVIKQLFFNTLTDTPDGLTMPSKIEGIAHLDSNHLLLINDNDFGIAGDATTAVIIDITDELASSQTPTRLNVSLKDRYDSGLGEGAAEIVTYDKDTNTAFTVNAISSTVDVLKLDANGMLPADATPTQQLDVTLAGQLFSPAKTLGNANSVDTANGILAVAVEANPKQNKGVVAFYSTSDYSLLGAVEVGALPDMVKFTPDGNKVLVANEGEPNADYTRDPEGSVSIIDVSAGVTNATVNTSWFSAFNVGNARNEELDSKVRIFGLNATVAQDLEPEYIAISADSKTAWVSLQENNALAIIDIDNNRISSIAALGYKDYSLLGNELDVSNRDIRINITNWPVFGMYQPDSIDTYSFMGMSYVVTANEGDSRDYDGFSEEVRGDDLTLDPTAFPDAVTLQLEENLGRLKTTTATGDEDGDGDHDKFYSYGARSFSIWNAEGRQVFDSGSDIAYVTAARIPALFNQDDGEFDGRSDDKGAEPEGLTTGVVNGRRYAFVGLERANGFFIYDITSPYGVQFIDYVIPNSGDISPEGMKFISAENSPTGKALLLLAHEVSGTAALYEME